MERSNFGRQGSDAEARHATVLKCDIVGSTRVRKARSRGTARISAAIRTNHYRGYREALWSVDGRSRIATRMPLALTMRSASEMRLND
jgi:hypothetical protein